MASAETRELCILNTKLRRQLKPYKLIARFALLQQCFLHWKDGRSVDATEEWLKTFHVKQALIRSQLNDVAWKLRKQLQADRKAFLASICEKVIGAKPGDVFRMLRPLIGTCRRNGVGVPLPQVNKPDGTATASHEEYQRRWTEHFAQLEGGHEVDPTHFIRQELERQNCNPFPEWSSLTEVPTLTQLEAALRKVNMHKAMGPDGVPGEILHMFPREMAKILFPLMSKFAIRLHEPVQWKGGQLIKVYKGKGPVHECSSFRGILLMSTIGKAVRAGMRSKVNRAFVHNSTETHFGGKPAQSVIFGAQMVRHFISMNQETGRCCAVLFCDIASAFYRVLRQLATGASMSDEHIATVVARLGLSEEVMHKLHRALQGHSAHDTLGGTQPERLLLQESLTGTWFWTEHGPLIHTLVGTRPGDSWADITFNVLFADVIRETQQELKKLGLALTTRKEVARNLEPNVGSDETEGEVSCHATWADDLALLLPLSSPEKAVQQTGLAAQALLTQLSRFGMKASYGTAKTAVLLFIRGLNAVTVRRKVFSTKAPHIPVVLESETVLLPIVTQYKHLGGLVSAKANMKLEIAARIGKANAAFARISRKVLKAKAYPLKLRLQVFEATVMSIFEWGAGAWPLLSAAEWKSWQTACFKLFRRISPLSEVMHQRHVSNAQIIVSLQIALPEDRLHAARVRHVGSMVLHAPNAVWSLLKQDHKARQAYVASMQWLWRALERDRDTPKAYHWPAWEELAYKSPMTWKRFVRKAVRRYTTFRVCESRVKQAHTDILKQIADIGGTVSGYETHTQHYCLLCDQPFQNKRAWFLHSYHKHSYVSMAGQAAQGTSCPVCAKEYFCQEKLKHHLQYSAVCRNFVWHLGESRAEYKSAPHALMPWVYSGHDTVQHEDSTNRLSSVRI